MKPNLEKLKNKQSILSSMFGGIDNDYSFKKVFVDDILLVYREAGNKNFLSIYEKYLISIPKFNERYHKAYQNNIFGLISKDEAMALWIMSLELGCGKQVVEIGTFLGFSTIFLAEKNKVYAIDNKYDHFPNDYEMGFFIGFYHDGDDVCERIPRNVLKGDMCDRFWTIMGCKDNVQKINKFSVDAGNDVPDEIDMAFVDGDHGYEPCLADTDLYYPKIKKGGIIAFHDFNRMTDGVTLAVHEFYEANINELSEPYISDSIIWFVKGGNNENPCIA